MTLIGVPPFQIEIPDDLGQGQKQITDVEKIKQQIKNRVFEKVTKMTEEAKNKT